MYVFVSFFFVCLCVFLIIFLLFFFLGYVLLLVCLLIYCVVNHWLRMKHIYFYLIVTIFFEMFYVACWSLYFLNYDGNCLNELADALTPIIYPLLICFVIRSDSIFWRTIYITLQNTTRMSKILKKSKHGNQLRKQLMIQSNKYNSCNNNGNLRNNNNDNGTNSSLLGNSLRNLYKFGSKNDPNEMNYNNSKQGINNNGAISPLIDFLSMKVEIIDFAKLQTATFPIGHGSTALVFPAIYNNKLVAVKAFVVDELTLDVCVFFVSQLFNKH